MTERDWIARTRMLAERAGDAALLAAAAEADRRELARGIDDMIAQARASAFDVSDVEALAGCIDRLEAARRTIHDPPARQRRWWRRRG